jgi:heat shock transcription factor 1
VILAAPSLDFDLSKLKNDYQFFLNEILGIKNKQNELQKAITIIIT